MNERMAFVTIEPDVSSLAANYTWYWTLPTGMTLWHVSAVGSNAHDATIMIGDSGDTDQAVAATAIGDSGTPAEIEFSGFTSPHFDDGDVFTVTVDFDGAGGTAIDDLQIVLTFLVG